MKSFVWRILWRYVVQYAWSMYDWTKCVAIHHFARRHGKFDIFQYYASIYRRLGCACDMLDLIELALHLARFLTQRENEQYFLLSQLKDAKRIEGNWDVFFFSSVTRRAIEKCFVLQYKI